jgi:heat-inducible transcriptional repressor
MLDERRKKILWAIIQSHIDLNIPIGSLLITKRYPFGLSPATIRNIMAKLEEMGYITQPHTSAGRIPTEKGYRFYVDTLLEEDTLSLSESLSNELSTRLQNTEKDNESLLKEASRTLSLLSKYLAVAIPPRIEDTVLKHIKFIKYRKKKVLAVLISEEGIVKNIFIELDRIYTQQQLDKAANYLNNKFYGLTIRETQERLAYQLFREKEALDKFILNMLHLFKDMISSAVDNFSFNGLSGTAYLPDFVDIKHIKEILKAIEDKRFMLKLLNHISDWQGTRVFVGMENIMPAMKELSMVVSTYSDKKRARGAIGIIGPARMNYRKLIPIVDHTAKALTKILSET